MILLKESKLRH